VERLAFRDILRQDNNLLSSAYANLKVELASRFRLTESLYSQAKAPFIKLSCIKMQHWTGLKLQKPKEIIIN